ncbi:MAG: hypothetical protein ABIQ10_05315 [Gemmatimonadaceae bacterium]
MTANSTCEWLASMFQMLLALGACVVGELVDHVRQAPAEQQDALTHLACAEIAFMVEHLEHGELRERELTALDVELRELSDGLMRAAQHHPELERRGLLRFGNSGFSARLAHKLRIVSPVGQSVPFALEPVGWDRA